MNSDSAAVPEGGSGSNHLPVLVQEVVNSLVTEPAGRYLDATVGMGGHASAILKKLAPEGKLLGLDWDPRALQMASEKLSHAGNRVRLLVGNFREIDNILKVANFHPLTGSLFDLGVSSCQMENGSYGIGFKREGPLDMRLNPSNTLTAETIVNEWPVQQLTLLIREYGEERLAYKIAKAIVEKREKEPIRTTRELKNLIESRVPRMGKIHPATRTFMALRIAVNQELDNLTSGLEGVAQNTSRGGRIAVISFHSLEDRIVKHLFQSYVSSGGWEWIVKHPRVAGPEEVGKNPKARSAKLRVVEKVR